MKLPVDLKMLVGMALLVKLGVATMPAMPALQQ
jgi:hypothetical protein